MPGFGTNGYLVVSERIESRFDPCLLFEPTHEQTRTSGPQHVPRALSRSDRVLPLVRNPDATQLFIII
jgi:hypothetical protein